MNLDDNICYCYHVPMRKLVNFARRERLVRASQMSNCLGAGTGCGWCIPILCRIYDQVCAAKQEDGSLGDLAQAPVISGLPDSAKAYSEERSRYLKSDTKHQF